MEELYHKNFTHIRLKILFGLFLALAGVILFSAGGTAWAQTYYFELVSETVNVFWNQDGTQSIDYLLVFRNETWASPIDFVDVGLPNEHYVMDSIFADVNRKEISNIEVSPYVEHGVALDLGSAAIPPGETGDVHAFIGTVHQVIYPDEVDQDYVSAVFSPTWFESQFVSGNTDITVIFHLPPGVQPDEPRWHASPPGFPDEPQAGYDEEGRITYTWRNSSANSYTQYIFGASFPQQYIPSSSVVRPSPLEPLSSFFSTLIETWPLWVCGGGSILYTIYEMTGSRRRKLQYLPPKISIEGHGIKRGLTAVEAAILMEQPLDKVLTMVLFSVIMKGAARVRSKDPLELEILDTTPEGLRTYEQEFLKAFEPGSLSKRRASLQRMMVNLVRGVAKKMKGFSRRETVSYYQGIITKAWKEVEAAQTPQVMSEKYEEHMQWTMLDRNYDDRTRRVLNRGPIFIPAWWSRFDPGYTPTSIGKTHVPSKAGGTSIPQLPGADFAASVVNGVQNFSSSVIGDVTDFTSVITRSTNPIPKSSSSGSKSGWKSGGGGGSGCACACACACAGCACACAGGGR